MSEPKKRLLCFCGGECQSESVDEKESAFIEDLIVNNSSYTGALRLARTGNEIYPWVLVICLWPGIAEAFLAADIDGLQDMLKRFIPLSEMLSKLAAQGKIPQHR